MSRYRVPVEFEARDDEEARYMVATMVVAAEAEIMTDEITIGRIYWEKLPKENS